MVLFSIIVPIYNVEKYIFECAQSVLKQSYHDFELILVDDGSKDRSGQLCDSLAEKDSRVQVIHKPNGGLSDARNAGIHAAKGDYILFLDGDDYIADDSLEYISKCVMDTPNPVDVVFLEANKIFPNGEVVSLGDCCQECGIVGKSKQEVMRHLATRPKYPGSACTKLIRKKVILDNDLYFEKGLLSEDIDWTIRLLKCSEIFSYCGHDYYYYRQNRDGSITNTVKKKSVEDLFYIVKKWSNKDVSISCQREFNACMAYEYMIVLYYLSCLTKKEREELLPEIKKLAWVMQFASTKKTKLVATMCKVCGVGMTSMMLRQVYKNK